MKLLPIYDYYMDFHGYLNADCIQSIYVDHQEDYKTKYFICCSLQGTGGHYILESANTLEEAYSELDDIIEELRKEE